MEIKRRGVVEDEVYVEMKYELTYGDGWYLGKDGKRHYLCPSGKSA